MNVPGHISAALQVEQPRAICEHTFGLLEGSTVRALIKSHEPDFRPFPEPPDGLQLPECFMIEVFAGIAILCATTKAAGLQNSSQWTN